MTLPKVTIIIPAYNEENSIKACLESLIKLDYPESQREIIIVDDGSTDSTRSIIAPFDVVLTTTDHCGPSKARNIGIECATGQFIAFTDADCIVDQLWIKTLVDVLLANPTVASVGGKQKGYPNDPPFAKRVQHFLEMVGFLGGYTKDHHSLTEVDHNASCNTMYRKKCLIKVQGFRPGLFPGEDVDLDYRIRKAGYSILYEPSAIVYHQRPKKLSDYARMIYSYGKGSGGYLLKRFGLMRPLQLFFPFFLFLLVGEFALMLKNIALFVVFNAIIFLTTCYIIYIKIHDLRRISSTLLLLAVTVVMWNVGFIRGIFWKGPSISWQSFTSQKDEQ